MNRINLGSLIIKVIVAGMLLLAVFGRHPYSFYTLLRWVACGACAYTAFQAIESKKTGWSEVVNLKVARALLAALRDFGVLEGKMHKRLANQSLSPQSFAWLAFCLHLSGRTGRNLLEHPDWHLFTMSPGDVEHLFFECHQMRLLEYHAAGSTILLSFPASTPEEYAHVVLGR